MLGELNSSHLGFNSRGDEEKTFHRVKSMQTGVIFEKQAPYTVQSIVTGSAVDKKGIDIKPGDVLTAVNNREVDPRINREFYFTAPSMDDELELTFKRESENKTFTVKVHPLDTRGLKRLLYDEWIRKNQRLVDQKSGRRIAYIHMKSMGSRALDDFLIEMTTESYKREGLILDLRYNTGGNVHDAVLNFLSQRPYTLWKYRGGEFAPQPNFAPSAKPIVLLINEQSLSDAEMTAAGFKELKLGKIIGTETYRWLIFTSGKRLVDGSYYRLPSWGCYTLDKKNLEKHGAAPDIYIKNTFKDRLEGKDPQLEAAVNEILKQLK
jgi:tricorn protease